MLKHFYSFQTLYIFIIHNGGLAVIISYQQADTRHISSIHFPLLKGNGSQNNAQIQKVPKAIKQIVPQRFDAEKGKLLNILCSYIRLHINTNTVTLVGSTQNKFKSFRENQPYTFITMRPVRQ